MRKRTKNAVISVCVLAVFLFRLKQGLSPAEPAPGMLPSGAMNEPLAVIFSALLLSALTWLLLELIFRFLANINNKRS